MKDLYACSSDREQISAFLLAWTKEEAKFAITMETDSLVAVLAHLSGTAAVLEDSFQQSFS